MNSLDERVMAQASELPSDAAKAKLIIVMGVSGCGKSSLAQQLAKRYGFSYLEGDDFHTAEAKARMANGLPLDDEMRRPWVASICARLQQALAQGENCILAFSGLRAAHRQAVRQVGLDTQVLFLRGSQALIQERVNRRTDHFMNPSLVNSQFEALEDPCAETNVHPLDVSSDLDAVFTQAQAVIERAFPDIGA